MTGSPLSYKDAKGTGMRCTNSVIQIVTGKMAIGYSLSISCPALGAKGLVFLCRFMSKTKFCAVGIEPSTISTRRQMGSFGRAPRAASPPTMAIDTIGIKISLTSPTVPRTLASIGSLGSIARSHCSDFLCPFACAVL